MTRAPLSTVLLVVLASPSYAQSAAAGDDLSSRWIAVGVGAIAIAGPEVAELLPSAHLRFTISPNIAIETTADFDLHDRVYGLYRIQAQFSPNPAGRTVVPFVVAGLLGSFESAVVAERQITLPTGDLVTLPRYRRSELSAPLGGLVGGGARFKGPARTWLQAGAQVMFGEGGGALGFQFALVVPFGPRRVSP